MSFSAKVKSEMARVPIGKSCCAVAEAYGLLLYAGQFSVKRIRLMSSNAALSKRLPVLFSKAFGITLDRPKENRGISDRQTVIIEEESMLRRIFSVFGYEFTDAPVHVNMSLLEDPCCRSAFIRGAFLSGGSVTDPEKRYHLELSSHHYSLTHEMMSVLLEMDFSPKISKRKYDYVIYFKDSGEIEDILTSAGAPMSAMSIMQVKVEKELRNDVNRRINCDDANITKAVNASARQLEAIRRLEEAGRLDTLPEPLKKTAALRKENPEYTLSELLPLFDPPVSKPGLSHRLNKLILLAKEYGYE